MMLVKLSTPRALPILLVDATDGYTEEPGLAPTVTVRKAGGVWAAAGGAAPTDRGNGSYEYTPTAAEIDTLGLLEYRAVAAGARTFRGVVQVVAELPGQLATDALDGNALAASAVTEVQAGLATSAAVAALPSAATVAAAVWDELLTAATHNVATSAGRRLRELGGRLIRAGTAQGAGVGPNQIQLDAGAAATDGIYDRTIIVIDSGTGAGQARMVLHYVGSTKIATVDRDWLVAPDVTSTFQVVADGFVATVHEGKAAAGGAASITFDAHASAQDSIYNLAEVSIVSGTGTGQTRRITAYVGATKVATIGEAWTVQPDATSGYVVLSGANKRVNAIATDTITAASVAADAVTELQAGLATAAAVAALPTAAAIAAAVLAAVVETAGAASYTVQQLYRRLHAYVAGGAAAPSGDGSYAFRGLDGATTVIGGSQSAGARTITTLGG